ncbi:uncharacterized protein [Montipora capricornis]
MPMPVTPATTQPPTTTQQPVTECGGLLNGSSGSFATPGYPSQPYPDDLNCVWTLSIPRDGFVIVEFLEFETEQRYDTVKLTDSLGHEITDRFSGSKARFYVTVEGKKTQWLYITFTSDSSIRRRGFRAQFGISLNMEVLGHWLLDGQDELLSFDSLPLFAEGRCPGSKAAFFNQTNSFASTPIINLNDRSFTIACWIKQTAWVPNRLAAIYSDWYHPWQFFLSVLNQKIIFQRHQNGGEVWWSLESTKVSLDTWTHVAVTWDHVRHAVFIYANGQEVGKRSYTPGASFFQPTGKLYQIGKDGHTDDHQFHGSVMDLYVFGTALKLDQINKLRGVPIIVSTTEEVTSGIVVAWEPPLACAVDKYILHYREVVFLEVKSNWHSVTVNRNETSYMLHLNCRKEYDVAVTSWSGHSESNLSDSKIWNFKTGGEVPSIPVIKNKETETPRCNVILTWSPPADNGCPLTMYTINYQRIQPRETEEPWYQVNHTDIMTTNFTISLSSDTLYKIEISAWNELGESERSRPWIIKTLQSVSDTNKETSFDKSPESDGGKGLSATQLSALIGGLCALLIIVSILIFALRRKAKRRKRLAYNLRPRRSKSTIFALRRWEVLPEQVVFKEEIGRGAFGKVFKATFKESPGIEVFYKPRTQTVDWKEDRIVAVKVLGDTTEEEARNQFLEEIELMKAIGSHRNIVSMLGCCVNSDPIFLVLEYVPYGDLLHWLRNKRIQKSYQKNYSNEENRLRLAAIKVQFSTDMDNESKQLLTGNEKETMDLSKLNVEAAGKEKEGKEIKPEMKEGVENHLEAQPVHVTQSGCHDNVQREEEFNVKDLLSFAWQIARGMNFLSSSGFVHRDLAARNVLLGEDKVAKISNFGLMRQTHESVYHLKKGKKIPVKWMAPEALYNSEYTTKSDVWSFGILLWELSTMGGNPYPGINNKELYNLLKTGYRMEQPNTCSDKLFELVLTCWKDEPSERPTFESATRSLEEMMQEDAPYLDLESLDESQAYYCSEKLSEDDVTV